MPLPTHKSARLRFEQRNRAAIEERLAHPEAQDALARFRSEIERRWRAGDLIHERGGAARHGPAEPGWFDALILSGHGLHVTVGTGDANGPEILVSPSVEAEQAHRAARLAHPQNLLGPAEYDTWEIRRDAPLARVLDDLIPTWIDLNAERQRLYGGGASGRGESAARRLVALEAYRRRLNGESWPALARAFRKGESTLRRAVSDICGRAGLPLPAKGTVVPDLPDVDCDSCPKRRSYSRPCRECPVIRHLDRYLGAPGDAEPAQ
jgi:hypothetical protein